MVMSGCMQYLAKAKINVCFLKFCLHTATEANLGLLHSEKFLKFHILTRFGAYQVPSTLQQVQ